MTHADPLLHTMMRTRLTAKPARDPRVFAEQVRLLYRELPVAVFGTTLAAVVIVVAMWGHAPASWLIGWLALVLLNLVWRVYLYLRFRDRAPAITDFDPWATLWIVGATISGVLFGIAGFAFVDPQSLFHQLLLLVILFGMASGAVPMLATYEPALYLFLVPAITPMAARMIIEGGPHLPIGIVLLIVLVLMVILGRYYGQALSRSLATRFENIDLIDALSAQKREAEEARNQAEIANRSKTQFFAAASHDLRQPLHAMGLFAAALVEKVRDPGVIDVVNSINASVEALETLFNELLDISKIDAGVIQVNPTNFSMQSLFDRLRMDLEPEAAEKDLRLRFVPTRAYVNSDPVLVERIVRNLVTNGVRYTRKGGIVVGCRVRGDRVWLEVWDSGIGIPAEESQRVFEEFYQVGNPERDRRKGLGLGLSIVKRLTSLLGAELSFDSRVGRGTVFRVSLPRGATAAPTVASNSAAGVPQSLGGAAVVVIDDESTVVDGMRVLLSGWGAQVIGAGSLEEARSELVSAQVVPDLLIADFRLRERANGLDAIASLRQQFGTDLPAILVTGSSSPELLDHAKREGVHLLAKPVMPAKLRTLVSFKLKETRRS
jgi:signal transduction histidine kinase